MNLIIWIADRLVERTSPESSVEIAMKIWPKIMQKVPQEQKTQFLRGACENHIGTILKGLDRNERKILMNSLLPLAAREFPLTELDIFSAYSSPRQRPSEETMIDAT